MKTFLYAITLTLFLYSCSTEKLEAQEATISTQKQTISKLEASITADKKESIADLISAMETLTFSHSIALKRMSADFAITDMIDFISQTVASSEFILSGMYMTNERIPWVHATINNPSGMVQLLSPLDDTLTKKCVDKADPKKATYTIFKDRELHPKGSLMEFCAPVLHEDSVAGYIRYTFSHELIAKE